MPNDQHAALFGDQQGIVPPEDDAFEVNEPTSDIDPASALAGDEYYPKSGEDGIAYKRQILSNASTTWQPIYTRISENHAFIQGKQWTDEEILAHEEQGRLPIQYNLIGPIVRALFGRQLAQRKDWKLYPRERTPLSVLRATNAAMAMNAVAQMNDWQDIVEEQVFEDATCGIGWAATFTDYLVDGSPYPKLDRVDWREVMFDTRSRRMDLNDAYWLARQKMLTLPEALSMWPGKRMEILRARGQQNGFFANQTEAFQAGNILFYDQFEIPVIEYYEKRLFPLYVLSDPEAASMGMDADMEFGSEEEANAEYSRRMEQYTQMQQMVAMQNVQREAGAISQGLPFAPAPIPELPALTIDLRMVPRIIETRFVNADLLDEETLDTDRFPYVPAFQFYDSGSDELTFYGLVDVAKDPQRFMNRLLSTAERINGQGTKNLTTVDMDSLREGQTEVGVAKELSRVNPVLFVNQGMHDAVKVHPNSTVPQEYTQLLTVMRSWFDQFFPSQAYGAALPGAQGGVADPSGRAIFMQQQVADTATAIIFHRFTYFRKLLGENLLFYLQHGLTTPDGKPKPMTFQLLGKQNALMWSTLNTSPEDSISDDKFTVTVSDTDYSVSGMAVANQQLGTVIQQMGATLATFAPAKLEALLNAWVETSAIPEDTKQIVQSIPMMPMPGAMPTPNGAPPERPASHAESLTPTGAERSGGMSN